MKFSGLVFAYTSFHLSLLCSTLEQFSYKHNLDFLDWLKLCPPVYDLLEFDNWRFSTTTLCESLPCGKERKGFIGNTHGMSFLFVEPEPFKNEPKLVAISYDVVANILDLNPSRVLESASFVQFSSGRYVLPSSSPVAHRYGGHQVCTALILF